MTNKDLMNLRLNHFAKIFTKFAILCLIYILFCYSYVVFAVFQGIYYLLLACAVILSLGIVFAIFPNFGTLFESDSSGIYSFFESLAPTVPYIIAATICLAGISILFLSLSKNKNKTKSTLITNIVVISITAIILFLYIFIGGLV